MFVHLKSINEIRFIPSTSVDKLYYLREWLKQLNEFNKDLNNLRYANEIDICLREVANYANLDFPLTELPIPEQTKVIETIVRVNFDDFKQKKDHSRENKNDSDKNKSIDADKYLSNQLIRLVAMNLCNSINQAYSFASSITCRDLENILNDQYELLTAKQEDKGVNPEEAKKFTEEILSGNFFSGAKPGDASRSQKSKINTKKSFLAAIGIDLDQAEKNKVKLKQQEETNKIINDDSVPLEIQEQVAKDFPES